MASINDRRTIYVVQPIYEENLGNKELIGYGDLKIYHEVLVVPAYSEIDVATYGTDISSVMKFQFEYPIDISTNGGTGIYLNKPTIGEDGVFHNPEYISTPLITHRNVRLFDGKKQKY